MKKMNYIAPHAEQIRLHVELPLALSGGNTTTAPEQNGVVFEGNEKDSWSSEIWDDTEM